jgi:mRNA interferase RelE/StbE
MPELVLHRRVQRYARRLPADLKEKVKASLTKLAEDPDNYPGAITMAGQWQGYRRIRIGNLRVIYSYQAEAEMIYVDYLGPRGEIYKR